MLVNGRPQGVSTPGIIRISKSELFTNNLRNTITIEKNGYTSNERYEVFITSLTEIPLQDVGLIVDENNNFTNINNIDIRVAYYVDNVLTEFNFNSELITLNFNLTRAIKEDSDERKLTTVLTGDNESVILERIRDGERLPISDTTTERVDKKGTRYVLKSVDPTIYRVGAIRLTVDGKTESLFADEGENLTTEITLNNNVQVEVISQRLVLQERIQPRIRVLDEAPRTYNKNEPSGIPILIYRNSVEVVKAVSVIIGEQMFEFDNLGDGRKFVINLPAAAFENLGSYRIKIFPYSISELEKYTVEAPTPQIR